MSKLSYYREDLLGLIKDIDILNIETTSNALRSTDDNVVELTDSIKKIGLLSPLVVRTTPLGTFEIVAGNRRYKACKNLGWKEIRCNVVDLDDKTAFEVSIIENVQRQTLNIIEEGIAFRKYVNDFGWGSVTELANKLSKSTSYISKRMRLVELPKEVLYLISQSEISASSGEELLSLKEQEKRSELAMLVLAKSLSSKKLRLLIKEKNNSSDSTTICLSYNEEKKEKILQSFDKSIIVLKIGLRMLVDIMEKIENEWIIHEILMNHRNSINSQIDLLIREKKKFVKKTALMRKMV